MNFIKRNGNFFPTVPVFFDDLFSRELYHKGPQFSHGRSSVPAVNIKETETSFEVEVAAPGMDKKDFRITLENNMLTISSSKEVSEEKKENNYTRREFHYQSFQRSFQLPKDVVDEDRISAHYENGLLHLVIPKKEEAKQKASKTIEVE